MSELNFSSASSNLSYTANINSTDSYVVTTVDTYASLNVPYTVCEVIVATCAVVGNALVILVFRRERRLRRRTNYYIISLATADLLVGLLGIPFAVLASIGLPRNLYACLFTVSLLVVLCTISIFCLVAVSVDRYWAILHPMAYSRNVRTKTAIGIIGLCWFSGSLIGFLPLLGWHADEKEDQRCLFVEVMDYNYLVFLYFATIIFPALLLAAFYAHIYQVVLKQLRQIVTMNPTPDSGAAGGAVSTTRAANGGTMLRVFGAAQKREVKATKNLSIIVFFFIICWIPLYTINCVLAFCPDCHVSLTLTNCCIILSHLNSAGNPLLYAYHLRDFRAALKHLLYGMFGLKDEVAEYHGPRASFGSNVHHPHAVHTSRNNSLQSLRDVNPLKLASYADFKMANSCLPASLPPLLSELPPKMWTLQEVPSVCEDDVSNSARRISSAGGQTPVLQRSVAGRSMSLNADGKVNSAYIDDGVELEEGDDDVFHDSVISDLKPSPNMAHLNELPFRNYSYSIGSFHDDRMVSCESHEIPPTVRIRSRSSSLGAKSSCETQDHLNASLVVKAEINDGVLDVDDRTDLSTSPNRSPPIAANGDLNKVSGNNNSNNSSRGEFEDKQCINSPLKHLTRSPLKYVGGLLFRNDAKSMKDVKKDVLDNESKNVHLNGDVKLNAVSTGGSSAVT